MDQTTIYHQTSEKMGNTTPGQSVLQFYVEDSDRKKNLLNAENTFHSKPSSQGMRMDVYALAKEIASLTTPYKAQVPIDEADEITI